MKHLFDLSILLKQSSRMRNVVMIDSQVSNSLLCLPVILCKGELIQHKSCFLYYSSHQPFQDIMYVSLCITNGHQRYCFKDNRDSFYLIR